MQLGGISHEEMLADTGLECRFSIVFGATVWWKNPTALQLGFRQSSSSRSSAYTIRKCLASHPNCMVTAKDIARLLQFLEQGAANMDRFAKIVERHTLSEAWERFRTRYLYES